MGPGEGWTQRRDVHGFTASIPSFRRRGIGWRLTETIVAWCRERGFRWIYLHASEQGRPLYESLGFEASSEMRLKL
jgi:GNAT superfamily N-acetyltransferase